MIITKKIPLGVLKVSSRVEGLLLKTKNAQKAALYLERANATFEATLKSTKYGKYLIEPIQTGLQAEGTGLVFGALEDDMSFAQGFAGGFASEVFGAVVSKLPANKILGYVESAFGSNANRAVAVIEKIADINVRAAGETIEEFADQLVGIYQDELTAKGFWAEVENQFGTLDKVQKFAISSYMMGLGFGVVGSSNKAKLDNVFDGEKKKQVEAVLSSVRQDYETAEAAVDDYVDEQEQQNETEKAIEEEPETLPKTNEEGDIEFDVNAIERTAEGKPSVVATEEGQPSSFTEPIDFNTTEENDKKDEQGVSGQVGEGEKPVETEPVAEPSKEEISPSGVVQGEQEQVKPTPRVVNVLGKDLNSYTDYIPSKEDVELEALYSFTGNSKEDIPELLRDKAYANTFEINGQKLQKWYASISGSDLAEMYSQRQTKTVTPTAVTEEVKTETTAPEKEEGEVKRVYKAEQIAKTLGGKVVGSATKKGAIPNDFDIYIENKIDWKDMREKMDSLGYKPAGSSPVINTDGKKFKGENQRAFHFVDSKGQKVDVFQEETNEDFSKRMREQSALAETQTTNAFDEISEISKIKSPTQRKVAEKEFNAKYPEQGKRISKIHTNFANIVKGLEKNNLINKDCG